MPRGTRRGFPETFAESETKSPARANARAGLFGKGKFRFPHAKPLTLGLRGAPVQVEGGVEILVAALVGAKSTLLGTPGIPRCAPLRLRSGRDPLRGARAGSGTSWRQCQIFITAPDHVAAQLIAHQLHLVLLELGALGVEESAARSLFSAIHLPAKVPS